MKSNTYELHNYADLSMSAAMTAKESRKRKASTANSSRRNEKYSLRQKRRKGTVAAQLELPSGQTVPTANSSPAAAAAISAVPATAAAKRSSKSTTKAKTKAAPLSKYRRKTANARERTRMREINSAFEHLRHCVPQSITGEDAANTNEKLTKITTLRLAMKYIHMLSESLENPSYESDFLVECLRESAAREAHVTSEPEMEPTIIASKSKKSVKAGNKKTPAKRSSSSKQSKVQATAATTPSSSAESCYASSSIGSPVSCAAASSPSSAYASLSSFNSTSSDNDSRVAVPADSLLGMQALSELNSLLLESDGESLQLSDNCLSPSYHSFLSQHGTELPSRGDMPISISSLDKTDVELSLRLLDSSADSFDFGSDQQPSGCISPLATLDSFNPFSDLLHTDFPEPNALDLFLT